MNPILIENVLIVIKEDGEIIYLPRVEGEKDHHEAYERLSKLIPGLLDGFEMELNESPGFELANHVAATGRAVIWPSDITDAETTMFVVTLPKPLSNNTALSVSNLLPVLIGREVYANTAHFSGFKNTGYINEEFPCDGTYIDAECKIMQYIKASMALNSLSTETEEDIRRGK